MKLAIVIVVIIIIFAGCALKSTPAPVIKTKTPKASSDVKEKGTAASGIKKNDLIGKSIAYFYDLYMPLINSDDQKILNNNEMYYKITFNDNSKIEIIAKYENIGFIIKKVKEI